MTTHQIPTDAWGTERAEIHHLLRSLGESAHPTLTRERFESLTPRARMYFAVTMRGRLVDGDGDA